MSLVIEIWRVLTARQKRAVLAAQVMSVLMAFSTVGGIAAIAPFFAVLADSRLIDHNPVLRWLYDHGGFTDRRAFSVALGLGFIAVIFTASLINLCGLMLMNRLALAIGNELQSTLFAEYLGRPYLFHARSSSTALYNNIVYETARLTNGILTGLFTVVTNLVTSALIIFTVLLLNPTLSIAMIAFLAGGYALIYIVVRNRLLKLGQAQSRAATRQARAVGEAFGAIREVTLAGAQAFFRTSFDSSSKELARSIAHSHGVGQSPRHVMECVAVAGMVVIALFLSGRNQGAGPWLARLSFVAFAAYRLLPTLQQAFAAIVKIRADRAGFALIAPDLRQARAAARTVAQGRLVGNDPRWLGRPAREIRLCNVSFRYSQQRPWALDGISLSIAARTAVGIVGANGSGKTTLIELLAGLLPPTTGHMEVDGMVVDHTNQPAWQGRIAYVPQSIFLLDGSIAENIAFGVAREAIDPRRLEEAARLAQLDELVGQLPGGYDHQVGERGVRFSGGQRQRIAIARALYRDASVLLLDEATSALDGLIEEELIATLGKLRGRYTMILIAHRLSTVRMCDVIFELASGRIVASGAYEEVMKQSDAVRRMAAVD
jgi:HlyD family secretion protein